MNGVRKAAAIAGAVIVTAAATVRALGPDLAVPAGR